MLSVLFNFFKIKFLKIQNVVNLTFIMKKICLLIVALLCAAMLLSGCGGDVKHVERRIGASELYAAGEIRMAMEKKYLIN